MISTTSTGQIAGLNKLADSLEQDSPASTLRKVILALSDYQTLTRKIGAYLSLRQSANTTDQQIVSINSRFQNKISQSAGPQPASASGLHDRISKR